MSGKGTSRGIILSPQRSALASVMPHGVMDWRPFDASRLGGVVSGGSRVETILSPELEARREEVARRREEAARAERQRYHPGRASHDPHASPTFRPIRASGGPPPLSPTMQPTHARNVSSIPSITASRRTVPNANTSYAYDAGRDIFGSGGGGGSISGVEESHTFDAARRKSTMAAGRVHLDGEKGALAHELARAREAAMERERASLREIRMRTSGIECSWYASPESRAKPPPPGVQSLYYLLEYSRWYLALSIVLTLFSLFAHDFSVAFLPKVLDTSVDALLVCVLSIFGIEILANSYAKEYYCLTSFLFWLDLVGAFSICFDIGWINDVWFPTDPTSSGSGQVTSVLRLARFTRVLRILKLVRIVRVFKLQQSFTKTSIGSAAATSSKVGLTLSERQDKKAIGMLVLVLVLYPFFSVSARSDLSPQMGLEMIQDAVVSGDPSARDSAIATFLRYQADNNLFYLDVVVNATTGATALLLDDNAASKIRDLRQNEWEEYRLETASGGVSIACLDRRNDVFLDAVYTFCFTILIVLVFTAGSYMMSRDVQSLVVAPLDRMTAMVKKLAGTILFLNHPKDGGTGGDGLTPGGPQSPTMRPVAGDIAGFETDAIEQVIAQIGNIFSVVPDPHPQDSRLPKSLAMLSGSKHTQIKTLNSVVHIDVSERPRQIGEDEDLDSSDAFGPVPPLHLDLNAPVAAHLNVADFPECGSIDAILHHNGVLPYFRLFLASNLALENLLFVQEVDRFRTIMKLHVLTLYNAFVSPQASNQVNLPSMQRDHILSELECPSVSLFDESQRECLALMASFLKQFQQSKFCAGYMRKRAPRVRNPAVAAQLAAPIITHNPPDAKRQPQHVRRVSHAHSTQRRTPFGTPQATPITPLFTPSALNLPTNTHGGGHDDTLSSTMRSDRSHLRPARGAHELQLPGSVPSSPQPHSPSPSPSRASSHTNGDSLRAAVAAAATVTAISDGAAVPVEPRRQSGGGAEGVLTSFQAGASRRSTGSRRTAPALSVSTEGQQMVVAESDLDTQIAALIASEGGPRIRASLERRTSGGRTSGAVTPKTVAAAAAATAVVESPPQLSSALVASPPSNLTSPVSEFHMPTNE